MAKGEILSWLNSDDLLLPGAITKVVTIFRQNPDVMALYGEGYLIDREGRLIGRFPHTQRFDLWRLVYLSDYILQQTFFFRKDVLQEVGYLDESLHYAMDWDFLIRVAKRYGLTYVPEYIGCLREYPEAKSFSGGAARVREIASVLRRHTGLRFPPGYLVYAFDTYQRLFSQTVQQKVPRLFRPLVTAVLRRLTGAVGYWVWLVSWKAQGWYSDGWVGPRVRLMFPAPAGKDLRLAGTLPCCPLGEQHLKVIVNGRETAHFELGPGEFEVRVGLPCEVAEQAVEVTLMAARSFREAAPRLRARRLCYVLREANLLEADGTQSARLSRPRGESFRKSSSRPGV